MREQFASELAWAAQHLPNEHGPFVASAVRSMRMKGYAVNAESVKARLRDQGRTMEQLG